MEIGEQLKQARLRKGISVTELGSKAGLSFKYIYNIEAGKANPTIKSIRKVLNALDLGLVLFNELLVTKEDELIISCSSDGSVIEKNGYRLDFR